MSFIHPYFLWALPAALLPVIIHFIFLRRSRKIPFSSIFLLREVYLRSLPRSRLEQWFLLLLRCLALALIILAFSRPVLRLAATGTMFAASSSGTPLRLVILADTSYSMRCLSQGEQRYSVARSAVISVLKTLKPSDKAALGFFSDRWEGVPLEWSSDFPRLQKALEYSGPGFRKTDYRLALESAFRFLSREEGGKKVILVLSDGAAHGFTGRFDASKIPFYDSGVLLLGISFGEARENAWVDSFSAGGTGFWEAVGAGRKAFHGPVIEAFLRIDGGSRGPWPVRLLREEGGLWEKKVDLREGRRASVSWEVPGRGAMVSGRISLKEDSLPVDDSYYYSFNPLRKLKILCVYSDPSFMNAGRGGFFIRKIFGLGQDSLLPFSCDFIDWSRLQEINTEDYSAVIAAGFAAIGKDYAGILDSYVRRGGGLFILPDISTGLTALSEIRGILPVEINAVVQRRATLSPVQPPPSGAGFSWKDFDLGRLYAGRFFAVEPRSGAEVLWRFEDGRGGQAALVGGNQGRGRVLYFACAMDPSWTSLPVKPVFTAWMGSALAWAARASSGEAVRSLAVGEIFEKNWENLNSAPVRVRVSDPEGVFSVLPVKDGRLRFDGTRVPGLYRWTAEGTSEAGIFAVNVDPSSGESSLREADSPPWKKLGIQGVVKGFMSAAYGVEMSSAGLLLAFALLLMEGFLSGKIL